MYLIKKLFLLMGIYVQKSTSSKAAQTVIRKFWPKKTEHNLVRVGGAGDGGYLIPESQIEKIAAVFSPGVADTANFELFFAERGVPCFLIDASVLKSPVTHSLVKFERLWLAEESREDSISLKDWVGQEMPASSDLLLQIDIEGAEFETLLTAPEDVMNQFRVIVIEIHDMQAVLSRSGSRLLSVLASKLAKTHLSVHLHVNNVVGPLVFQKNRFPEVVEVTYIRNDLVKEKGEDVNLPHPLDAANTNKPDWALSK